MGEQSWVYMEHPESGGGQYFPDNPGVLELHQAKGWVLADPPEHDDAIDAPIPGDQAEADGATREGDESEAPESEPAAPATTTQQAAPAADKEE